MSKAAHPRFASKQKKKTYKDPRRKCNCGSYIFEHREGSGLCIHNPIWYLPPHISQHIAKDKRGCWNWTAELNRNGYGTFREYECKGKRVRRMTHIVVYRMLVGEYGDGLYLDHKCRNRACCNPKHLEPVTPLENTVRGLAPLFKKAEEYEMQ